MDYIHAHSRTISGDQMIKTVPTKFYVGRVSLMFMLFVIICSLGVLHLVNFTNNSTKGYELTSLEFQRSELMNVKEQNNLSLSRSQSLDYITESDVVKGMVPIRSVTYFDGASEVALK
jgi:hypothetical protein